MSNGISVITPEDKANALESVNLICVNTKANSNKFWAAWVLASGDLYVEYGRQGYKPKPHFYNSRSVQQSRSLLRSLIGEKQAKGYVQIELEAQPSQELDFSILGDRASEIQTAIAAIQTRWQPFQQFAHIRFEADRGQFRTELGGITRKLLESARASLQQVEKTLKQPEHHEKAVAEYLRLIPVPVGMKLDASKVLGKPAQVKQQRQLLQTLEECFNQIDEIRSLIQSELAGARAEFGDRAVWVNWGLESTEAETDGTALETGENEVRSLGVVWA